MSGMDHDPHNLPSDAHLLELLQRSRDAVEAGLSIDVEETIGEIFAMVHDKMALDASPDWQLAVEANECELCGNWTGAEIAYQRILDLAGSQPHSQYSAHRSLAKLNMLLNREAIAVDHCQMATAAARREDLTILLLMALRQEAGCLIHCDRLDEAKKVVAEAFAILKQDEDQKYTQLRGSNLVLRAVCSTSDGKYSDAQADLDSAYDLFEPMARVKIAAGIQEDLARWWVATGRLRTARRDFVGAVQAWQEAVALSKHVNSLPQCADVYTASGVAHMLQGLADALTKAGNLQGAQNAAAERSELLELLSVPHDQGPRH